MSGNHVDRREFLATGVGLAAAIATSPVLASPNDRIRLGIVGCGGRGTYLLNQALAAAPGQLEIVALCDVWSVAREKMAALLAEKLPGQKPRLVSRHQELLETPGLDGVIIATPDFAHPGVLIDAVRAGKDAFVEKPLSARLEDAVAALDAVEASKQIVQVGTQRRSNPQFQAAAEYVRSGALGSDLQDRNGVEPQRTELAASRRHGEPEADVDWEQYQMYHPKRPFDPVRYRCWHWYYEYTTGLVGLLGSHMIDVALWFMNDPFPASAVALGDILTWKDGRQTSDTAEYVFEFPKGWLLTFSSRLGSGPETDYEIFYGQERTLDTRDWISRSAANKRPDDATDMSLTSRSWWSTVTLVTGSNACGRVKTPNAPIQAGFAHAVACCLGREAERTGRKMRYDPATRRIVEARPFTRLDALGESLTPGCPGTPSGHVDLLGRSRAVPQLSSPEHDDRGRSVGRRRARHADAIGRIYLRAWRCARALRARARPRADAGDRRVRRARCGSPTRGRSRRRSRRRAAARVRHLVTHIASTPDTIGTVGMERDHNRPASQRIRESPCSVALNFVFFLPSVASVPATSSTNAPSPVKAPVPLPSRTPLAPVKLSVPFCTSNRSFVTETPPPSFVSPE